MIISNPISVCVQINTNTHNPFLYQNRYHLSTNISRLPPVTFEPILFSCPASFFTSMKSIIHPIIAAFASFKDPISTDSVVCGSNDSDFPELQCPIIIMGCVVYTESPILVAGIACKYREGLRGRKDKICIGRRASAYVICSILKYQRVRDSPEIVISIPNLAP